MTDTRDRFIFHDGGRADAGFKGSTDDCVCRAIAIATGKPYLDVYNDLSALGARERRSKRRSSRSSARTGIYKATQHRYLTTLGWTWHPTMHIGSGCTVHLRAEELPGGELIVQVSKHVTAMIDGVIYDTYDPRRGGITYFDRDGKVSRRIEESRCVYGYWTPPPQ